MAKEQIKIVYTAGRYVVREIIRYACTPCRDGWKSGALVRPGDGGPLCVHGRGCWDVGTIGRRGGWHPNTATYPSLRAARIVCDALDTAASLAAEGIG